MIATVQFTDQVSVGSILTLAILIGGILISWRVNSARSWKDLAESLEARLSESEKELAHANERIATLEGEVASLLKRTDVTALVKVVTEHERQAQKRHEELISHLEIPGKP